MNKNTMIAIGTLCGAILLIIGSSVLYNNLVPQYNEKALTEENSKETTQATNPIEETKYVDIVGENYEGDQMALSDYVGENLVVVNFWASWCSWCTKEMPEFYEASQKYAEDVTFVMVDVTDGSRETKETAKQFLDEKGFAFENVLYDVNMESYSKYGITGLPTTLFIDTEGNIVYARPGAMDGNTLTSNIEKFIKE